MSCTETKYTTHPPTHSKLSVTCYGFFSEGVGQKPRSINTTIIVSDSPSAVILKDHSISAYVFPIKTEKLIIFAFFTETPWSWYPHHSGQEDEWFPQSSWERTGFISMQNDVMTGCLRNAIRALAGTYKTQQNNTPMLLLSQNWVSMSVWEATSVIYPGSTFPPSQRVACEHCTSLIVCSYPQQE